MSETMLVGLVVLVLPFMVVMTWEWIREKVQTLWLDGYSAGYKDGGK
jgi:hypothetical protein